MLEITYDKQTQVAYYKRQDKPVHNTEVMRGTHQTVNIDYAEDGTVIGIEMLFVDQVTTIIPDCTGRLSS